MALHLSDINTSLRAFTIFSSTSTTPNVNSRLFNEGLQNRDANHGARLHDEPAKRPTLHLVTLQEHRRLGGAADSRNIPSSVARMSNSASVSVSNSVAQSLPHTLITCRSPIRLPLHEAPFTVAAPRCRGSRGQAPFIYNLLLYFYLL